MTSGAPSWLAAAQPYVSVTNFVATVNPAIDQALSADVVAQVRAAVARYNALPFTVRAYGSHFGGPVGHTTSGASSDSLLYYGGGGGCYAAGWLSSVNWWGFSFYMNSCLLNELVLGGTVVAGAATIISLVCGPCAPFAIAIAALIGIYVGWALWADSHCGGRGIYVNQSWAGPWIGSVC